MICLCDLEMSMPSQLLLLKGEKQSYDLFFFRSICLLGLHLPDKLSLNFVGYIIDSSAVKN